MTVETTKTNAFVDKNWDTFVEGLQDFVRIPNLTNSCSPSYLTDGLVEKAFVCVGGFIDKLELKGIKQHDYNSNKTAGPMRVYTIEANQPEKLNGYKHVLLYGHLDKQPWGSGWITEPNDPVIIGDKMMGRGSADDGYSAFMAAVAIKNLQEQGIPTPRFTILLESEEESGSPNILKLLEDAKDVIGTPEVIFILDSGLLDYRSMWVTGQMRGIVNCDVTIDALTGGVHSGVAGGIVPEPHRVMRMLLNRVEDAETGMCKLPEVTSLPSKDTIENAKIIINDVGDELWTCMPFVEGCKPIHFGDNLEMYLRNTWHAAMAVIGFKGLPETEIAGNAMNPRCSFRLSFRISPDRDCNEAAEAIEKALTRDAPYGVKISANASHRGQGYNMKPLPTEFAKILDEESKNFYGQGCKYYGLGATIPLLSELQMKFPQCIIIATGVLGADCNAHGPNENMDLPYTKKFLGLISNILGRI